MMNKTKITIFCDFDGTISRRDIGYNIFHHFSNGKNDELLPDWKSGRLSSRDCLLKEAEMSPVTSEELFPFLDQFKIDNGFSAFEKICSENNIDIIILSDGFDLYINYLLKKNNLERLSLITNHGRIENGFIKIEFPHKNKFCTKCGSCKGERIREYKDSLEKTTLTVFVGDGHSDTCAIAEADILFAKKDLEKFCQINDIKYQPYDDFYDVIRQLEKMKILSKDNP